MRTVNSSAFRFKTGRTPGMPRQMGQVLLFGSAPNLFAQEQKAFDSVRR
jgi:hypothetical protein